MSLKKIGLVAEKYARCYPWNNVYALARTLLAAGTFLTLLLNEPDVLFQPAGAGIKPPGYVDFVKISIFNLFPDVALSKWLCIVMLLLVLSGWRPRITGILHWWVSFSLASSGIVIDGGDQITSVLSLLLLPICLTDNRKWHWSAVEVVPHKSLYQKMASLIAISTFYIIRLQVAIVYFHAAMGKFKVAEWENGTAIYYWLTNPIFGMSAWLEPLLLPIITNAWTVTLLTWSVLIFELLLFGAFFMNKKWYPLLLLSGIAFHFAIFIFHGLFSFFFAMSAALILYLSPVTVGLNPLEQIKAGMNRFRFISPAPKEANIET